MHQNNYKRIVKLAIPVILANASVPLLGLADTAAIGQTGAAADLGAIALASLIFNFVYWGFGFLRMGTTGFISQALGANDKNEVDAVFFRAVLLGLIIGLVLIILQKGIGELAIHLLNGSTEIKSLVRDYFYIRIWGAPATLITFTLLGTLIGGGWTKQLLLLQLFLNGLNVLLNLLCVLVFEMGVKGIALGTLLAEWSTLCFGLYMVLRQLGIHQVKERIGILWQQIMDRAKLISMVRVNSDIMIRTLALLSGFAWFANQGAAFGDTTLAANHVLLQFVSLSAFFLDGYAHVAEMLTGKAFGARDIRTFSREVRDSSRIAGITALCLALIIYSLGAPLVALLTQDLEVQRVASQHVIYAAIYIALSFGAFQLDGVFIGITKSKQMRNATLASLLVFLLLANGLSPIWGNAGLWISFIAYVVARALFLWYYYVEIRKELHTAAPSRG
ncbi:MAG TPA: MATE family efflux transporter [Candidatus Sphingobacterium stercorigallinarum]|nr:MATE family efflux transporter [Candidatus Sphingobacterium stercorigallinarum]